LICKLWGGPPAPLREPLATILSDWSCKKVRCAPREANDKRLQAG
jgi:hypothetical protein